MNNFKFKARCFFLFLLSVNVCFAQQAHRYTLNKMLKNGQLIVFHTKDASPLTNDGREGISVTGIVWLKGINFSTGSIDVDIRGKDVFQQSFVGIAFHGVDTVTYEAIYFRPFNFQSPDTLRRKHTVQYISEPEYPWGQAAERTPAGI